MMSACMILAGATCLLAQNDDKGWIQLIFVVIVVAVMLIGKLVQKVGQKKPSVRQREEEEYTPPLPPPPRQREKLSEVRDFFEKVQQHEKQIQHPAGNPRIIVERHRTMIPIEAPDGEEGPATEQGMTLVEALKAQRTEVAQAPRGVAAKVERPEPAMELESLVSDVRLSAGARAILLTEIMGSPRAFRPY
jgi:hypothetical protein